MLHEYNSVPGYQKSKYCCEFWPARRAISHATQIAIELPTGRTKVRLGRWIRTGWVLYVSQARRQGSVLRGAYELDGGAQL